MVLLLWLTPTAAEARAAQLWSERTSATVPLAQVPDFRALAQQAIPAVVSIHVVVEPSGGTSDWWGGGRKQFQDRGIGSGFVIRKDGLILTNNHVVEGARHIEVSFAAKDGEHKVVAEVVGTAPAYDVALLKTKSPLSARIAYLGNSDRLQIGDWVMAVGTPFGLNHSVSVGIVSAKERRNINPEGRSGLYDFIQTDASINPGNSGGPLVNMRGEVIGINTAVQSGNGIGFAIPINMVKALLPELQSKGRFTRSFIGLRVQPVTDSVASSHGLSHAHGALITEVIANGPAETGGLAAGDIILEFRDKVIRDSSDLALLVSMAGVGEQVAVKVWRKGRPVARTVRLTAAPSEGVARSEQPSGSRKGLGLTVADPDKSTRRRHHLGSQRGVVVTAIKKHSLAENAGLRVGDLLVTLNDRSIGSAEQFAKLVKLIPKGGAIRLKVRRAGGNLFIALSKP